MILNESLFEDYVDLDVNLLNQRKEKRKEFQM